MELTNQLLAQEQALKYEMTQATKNSAEYTEAQRKYTEVQTKLAKVSAWFSNISGAFSSLMIGGAAGTQAYEVLKGAFKKFPKVGYTVGMPLVLPGTLDSYHGVRGNYGPILM